MEKLALYKFKTPKVVIIMVIKNKIQSNRIKSRLSIENKLVTIFPTVEDLKENDPSNG